jgi:hypothetical protein
MVVRPRKRASRPCASTRCSTAATCRKPARWTMSSRSKPSSPTSAMRRLRCPHRLRRRPPEHHHGPLRRQLERWSKKAGKPTCSAKARSSPTPRRRSTDCCERHPRHHRPGSAALRDRRRRQAGRHHRGRRFGRLLQLPWRPRHRNHPRFRRSGFRQVRPRARTESDLRRHAAVRRRPEAAGASWSTRRRSRTPRANGSPSLASPSSPARKRRNSAT